MNTKEKDFYQKLRIQIKNWLDTRTGKDQKWSEFILLAPDLFHLMCKLVIDPDVPLANKLKLGAAIAYFIAPLDLLPEAFLGPIGYLDDISVTAYVIDQLLNDVHPQIVQKHWAGDKDILLITRNIVINANRMLAGGIVKKIKKIFRA